MSVNWNLIAGITFTGLAVVFLALILLILCMKGMGLVVVQIQNRRNQKETEDCAREEATLPQRQLKSDEVTPEVVAVIAAAIAADHPNEYPVAIHPVFQAEHTISAWRQAGVLQNTRAFEKGGV